MNRKSILISILIISFIMIICGCEKPVNILDNQEINELRFLTWFTGSTEDIEKTESIYKWDNGKNTGILLKTETDSRVISSLYDLLKGWVKEDNLAKGIDASPDYFLIINEELYFGLYLSKSSVPEGMVRGSVNGIQVFFPQAFYEFMREQLPEYIK